MSGDSALRPVVIFLSYRRGDTQWAARGIYDRLVGRYGRQNVFRDLDAIPPGARFRDYVEKKISESDVLILLMGKTWASYADETGRRRLEQPRDPVRLELETALRLGLPIIPVRVEGALMPTERDLVPSIVDLLEFNAAEVTDSRWEYDVDRLLRAIDETVESRLRPSAKNPAGDRDAEEHVPVTEPGTEPGTGRASAPVKVPPPPDRPDPAPTHMATEDPAHVDRAPESGAGEEKPKEDPQPATLAPPTGEGTSGPDGSAAHRGRTPGWRRWRVPVAAACVALVLVGALLAIRDRGGSNEKAFGTSTMLLTIGDKLMTYDADSGRLSTMPLGNVKGPGISPDRQWFSYLEWPGGNPLVASVPHVVRADGSSQDTVVPGTGPGTDCRTTFRPSWSPDGKQLALICKDRKTTLGLAVASTETPAHFVLKADWVCCGLTWVDDHTVVVGQNVGQPGVTSSQLVEVSIPDGTVGQPIVSRPGWYAHNPDWSDQDGLVYVESQQLANAPGRIMVAPPPLGSTARPWTRRGVHADFPAWDPSGRTLAYLVTDSPNRAGATYQMFTASAADDAQPAQNLPTGDLGPPAWGSR